MGTCAQRRDGAFQGIIPAAPPTTHLFSLHDAIRLPSVGRGPGRRAGSVAPPTRAVGSGLGLVRVRPASSRSAANVRSRSSAACRRVSICAHSRFWLSNCFRNRSSSCAHACVSASDTFRCCSSSSLSSVKSRVTMSITEPFDGTYVTPNGQLPITVSDINDGGNFIAHANTLAPGGQLSLHIEKPDAEPSSAPAEVLSADPERGSRCIFSTATRPEKSRQPRATAKHRRSSSMTGRHSGQSRSIP